jgi:hypothetical protein
LLLAAAAYFLQPNHEPPTALLRDETLPYICIVLHNIDKESSPAKNAVLTNADPVEIPQGTLQHQKEVRGVYLHPRGHLRPPGSSFPDEIRLHPRYSFCGCSHSSLRGFTWPQTPKTGAENKRRTQERRSKQQKVWQE